MARPPRLSEPLIVREGSVWKPRWPGKRVPLRVEAVVALPNGTNFVVKSLEGGQLNRTRRVSYKYLVGWYVPAD
jgi:hypothetical protein